jgi:hypothetical protein
LLLETDRRHCAAQKPRATGGNGQQRKTTFPLSRCSALGFTPVPGYIRRHYRTMTEALEFDLKKLKARAFDRADWADGVLRRYHAVILNLNGSPAIHGWDSWFAIFKSPVRDERTVLPSLAGLFHLVDA